MACAAAQGGRRGPAKRIKQLVRASATLMVEAVHPAAALPHYDDLPRSQLLRRVPQHNPRGWRADRGARPTHRTLKRIAVGLHLAAQHCRPLNPDSEPSSIAPPSPHHGIG
ncbi:hypothetical protein CAOG_009478 [Capsaspora owczarzaki ATCC 30864]|uniref:Uncharacterized protein n=1 Tax=Capsaspora owczarzaki (strain ATCC 30864) TaxID=595528 RepID=A0A0D2WKA8_CAPO3|nr:hypothetical protein CAOG_009478 [Capsaspora owczarzaki ATCC 30864]